MKTYSIKQISGTSLYKVFIPVNTKIIAMGMSFTRKLYLIYNTHKEEFYFQDQVNKFSTANLVKMSEEDFFQYSTVYEDILDTGIGVYELQKLQRSCIEFSNVRKTNGYIKVNV